MRISRRDVVAVRQLHARESSLIKHRGGVVADALPQLPVVGRLPWANDVQLDDVAAACGVVHHVFRRAGEAIGFSLSVAGFAAHVAGLAFFNRRVEEKLLLAKGPAGPVCEIVGDWGGLALGAARLAGGQLGALSAIRWAV